MAVRLTLAAFALGIASVSPVGYAASSERVPPSAVPALSARTLERLRANGLRADDPRLRERLAELASSRRRRAAGTSRVRFDLTNVTFPKISVFKYNGPLSNTTPTLQSGLGNPVFHGLQTKPAISTIDLESAFGVTVKGANLSDGTSYGATVITSASASCGQHVLTPNTYLSDPKDPTQIVTGPYFVAKQTPASLTVTVNGVSSDPVVFSYPPLTFAGLPIGTAILPISDVAPFVNGDGGLGLTKSAFASTTTADRLSKNVTGAPASGTDTIGYGVNLVNGYAASASIKNVHSYLDAPSNDGSNDQFRSATVVQQPQSGRLETKIAWKYEPGESIAYDIVWSFSNGPLGTRQVTTQPKQTTCSDEE